MPIPAGDSGSGLSNFFSTPYQVHNRARLAHLESLRLPLANRRVLELGSGPGDHTGFYVQRGCAVVSVDARQDCLDVLKQRYPGAKAELCDLNDPAALGPLGSFEVIHCYGILYHLVVSISGIEMVQHAQTEHNIPLPVRALSQKLLDRCAHYFQMLQAILTLRAMQRRKKGVVAVATRRTTGVVYGGHLAARGNSEQVSEEPVRATDVEQRRVNQGIGFNRVQDAEIYSRA